MGEFQIDGDLWWCIAAVIFLFFTGAINAAQTAAVTIADSKIKKLAEDEDKRAVRLMKLTAEPTRFLCGVETGRVFFALSYLICLYACFDGRLRGLYVGTGGWAAVLSALTVVTVGGALYLLLGVSFTKKLGAHFCEKLALSSVGGLKLVYKLFTPLAWLSEKLGSCFARLFGVAEGESDEQVTEEEIRMMVDVGKEKGVIEDMEKTMINNVFEFDDRVVAEVMTHRTEICGVEESEPLGDVLQTAIAEGYSRIPVYREDVDSIIGIIYVKDTLRYVGKKLPEGLTAGSVMREPYFVPESINCSELFGELTSRRIQLAIVVDEYGGTAGLVTIEDLLESIVGNMRDEYDDEEEEFVKMGDDTYEVDGGITLSDLEELLDVELPEGDYDTVGGLLLSVLGHIPTQDEHAEAVVGDLKFTVAELDNQRIAKVIITRVPPQPEPEE